MIGALRALLPGAAVLTAAVAVLFATDEATASELASTYGLVVYGAGLALSWVFHRSRAFIGLAVLVVGGDALFSLALFSRVMDEREGLASWQVATDRRNAIFGNFD